MKESPFQQTQDQVFVKFTMKDGKIVETTDDTEAYAKCSDRTFYVKFAVSTGQIFNPWENMNVKDEIKLSKSGLPKYSWMKINKSAFASYISFLETRNPATLDMAKGAI